MVIYKQAVYKLLINNTFMIVEGFNMDQNNNIQPQGNGKSLAIVSLVLGIAAAVICWFGWGAIRWGAILALVCGIVGIVFAVKARNAIPVGADGRGMATAGLVVSIIAVCLSGIVAVCFICALATLGSLAGTAGVLEGLSSLAIL